MNYMCFLILTSVAATQAVKSYDGYHVIRVTPTNAEEVEKIRNLQNTFAGVVDFWKSPSFVNNPVDIMVSPLNAHSVASFLANTGLRSDVMIQNVGLLADSQTSHRVASITADFDYERYNPLPVIEQWIDDTAAAYPDMVSIVSVANSFEGRTIRALKVGTPKSTGSKPIFWMEGGIHAREWISPATVIYMTNMLLEKYASDTLVKSLLDDLDFYILPVYNVDGYHFTWTGDRMWRKTRKPSSKFCYGIDPNRNWDFEWGNSGTNPCMDDYQGQFPHSESEVAGVTSFVSSLTDVRVFIDFHSYGQMWMSAWGYTSDLPPDFDEMYSLMTETVTALEVPFGTQYIYGSLSNTIYPSSGSSADWAYGAAGIKYSFGVELRDQGTYGFLLPETQIRDVAIETFEALLVLAKAARNM